MLGHGRFRRRDRRARPARAARPGLLLALGGRGARRPPYSASRALRTGALAASRSRSATARALAASCADRRPPPSARPARCAPGPRRGAGWDADRRARRPPPARSSAIRHDQGDQDDQEWVHVAGIPARSAPRAVGYRSGREPRHRHRAGLARPHRGGPQGEESGGSATSTGLADRPLRRTPPWTSGLFGTKSTYCRLEDAVEPARRCDLASPFTNGRTCSTRRRFNPDVVLTAHEEDLLDEHYAATRLPCGPRATTTRRWCARRRRSTSRRSRSSGASASGCARSRSRTWSSAPSPCAARRSASST